MRWVSFFTLAVGVLTLQSALIPHVELLGARPDLLLVVTVFFAMHAKWRDALVASWAIGAMADLMTIERFGLLALSYAMSAVIVASVRDFLFRYNAFSQFMVTAVAASLVGLGWLVYQRIMFALSSSFVTDAVVLLLLTPVYTGLLAPPLHAVLLPMSRVFGLTPPRYTFAGLHKHGGPRV